MHWGGPIWSTKAICDGIASRPDAELRVLTGDANGPRISDRVTPAKLSYPVHYAYRVAGNCMAPGLLARLPAAIHWADVVHLTGTYNMPDWGNDAEGLHQCIDSLFKHTPPTALIFGEPSLFLSTRQHLADQGIIAPRDVSMISMDPNPSFDWFQTSISHITWDAKPWINRVLKWAGNIALGKEDLKKTLTKAEFVEGSTIGPPPSK